MDANTPDRPFAEVAADFAAWRDTEEALRLARIEQRRKVWADLGDLAGQLRIISARVRTLRNDLYWESKDDGAPLEGTP